MKEILEALQIEEGYIHARIKNRKTNIEAIEVLGWEGNLDFERGALNELEHQLLFLSFAINRIKLSMIMGVKK